LLRS
ncbi:hypothetical protein D018_3688B, partial [Vibrio parahaemolyticus VP2007-007]|jgi:hypothetical protein